MSGGEGATWRSEARSRLGRLVFDFRFSLVFVLGLDVPPPFVVVVRTPPHRLCTDN